MTATPPPRHKLSPALRDLLALGRHDGDLDRVRNQVERVRGCTRPVQLTGYSATLDAETGEPLHVFTTLDEPTGRLLIPCGNRRASRCPSCSRLYAADTFHLIRAGLTGGKGTTEAVRSHPRVFATLTAPSFGPVHNRPATPSGRRLPCRCGSHHREDDPALGTPVHPPTYDYAGAVLWNAHASALWARFTTYLRRELAALLGLTQKELRTVLRVSFAKVAEYQKRGLVHFHAVIRLDGPDGSGTHPPAGATADVLTCALRRARERVSLILDSDVLGPRELCWGEQLDVREIAAFAAGSDLTDEAVAAYIAKYATKGAEDAGALDAPLTCGSCKGTGDRHGTGCAHCDGTGYHQDPARLPLAQHARQMVRTAWDLGALTELAHLKLRKWAHMLGFRGHFSTKSRRYSTTLGALRDTRRAWRADQSRARLGLADRDESTLVLESAWTFHGTGYTPGERLLAETVRQQQALALQLKHEGAEGR
ncbi:replication initiator protein RepSA [Streptomyces albiaxialis]|uniref:Replication initiator protein RepSA n=1 Tax=Streptomyces albiaxialis TaxID=329523 RepID=A0ABP5H3R1_9ACTN